MTTFEDVLASTGKLAYTNKGVSMRPLIREGKDVMLIESINRPLRKYDAVLFRRPEISGRGEYIMHRILRDNGNDTYFIIGDNCATGETVHRCNIFGLLTAVKRNAGQSNARTISCQSPGYQAYVRLWWAIFPLRKLAMRTRGHVAGLKSRLRRLGGYNK